jgi:hypothetical protein
LIIDDSPSLARFPAVMEEAEDRKVSGGGGAT